MNQYNNDLTANENTLTNTIAAMLTGVSPSDVKDLSAVSYQPSSSDVPLLSINSKSFGVAHYFLDTDSLVSTSATIGSQHGTISSSTSSIKIGYTIEVTDDSGQTEVSLVNELVASLDPATPYFNGNMTQIYAHMFHAYDLYNATALMVIIAIPTDLPTAAPSEGSSPVTVPLGTAVAAGVLTFLFVTGISLIFLVRHFERLDS